MFYLHKKGEKKKPDVWASCASLKTTQSVNFSHLKPSVRKLITCLLSCSAPSCTSASELSYLCIHPDHLPLFANSAGLPENNALLCSAVDFLFEIVRLEVWWHGDVPDAVMTEWMHHLLQIPSSRLRSYAARIWDNVGLCNTHSSWNNYFQWPLHNGSFPDPGELKSCSLFGCGAFYLKGYHLDFHGLGYVRISWPLVLQFFN